MPDPNDPKIPARDYPGIRISNPHTSDDNPDPHIDITFEPGKLPGQLPLPLPKIHVPLPPKE